MSLGRATLSFFLLLAVFESGLCLSCYYCNSAQNPNCKDPFSTNETTLLRNCEANWLEINGQNSAYLTSILPKNVIQETTGNFYCFKAIFNNTDVFRTCLKGGAAPNPNATCTAIMEKKTDKAHLTQCLFCNQDGCNSVGEVKEEKNFSHRLVASPVLSAVFIVTVIKSLW